VPLWKYFFTRGELAVGRVVPIPMCNVIKGELLDMTQSNADFVVKLNCKYKSTDSAMPQWAILFW
jgi:hypothetical protein